MQERGSGERRALTEDNGVGRKDGKVGVQLVEEVKLIRRAADGSGEEKDVALQP